MCLYLWFCSFSFFVNFCIFPFGYDDLFFACWIFRMVFCSMRSIFMFCIDVCVFFPGLSLFFFCQVFSSSCDVCFLIFITLLAFYFIFRPSCYYRLCIFITYFLLFVFLLSDHVEYCTYSFMLPVIQFQDLYWLWFSIEFLFIFYMVFLLKKIAIVGGIQFSFKIISCVYELFLFEFYYFCIPFQEVNSSLRTLIALTLVCFFFSQMF